MPSISHSCYFPASGKTSAGPTRPLSTRVDLHHAQQLQRLLDDQNGSDLLRSVLQVAWAVLLRCYTGLNEVCYGFEEVGGSPGGPYDHDGSSYPDVYLEVDGEMTLKQLIQQAHTHNTASTLASSNTHQFNTSILIRHAAVPSSTAKASPHSAVMTDKVSLY
ncbi:hypothetical protein GQ43DRAFT_441131 [Delitschia confertaspora ATCC 74209]|uniref:Uncharacterized protein n=1 Tax=Delitschia confertaspora ATCC 74209 TaxID=1513339 RepID=A0A9P4JK77_9PLEO|nr:hypothetical protein GQ43DRAFT_441131 [Delitschia confertaspora ATCC 74209]